jgi:single-stranded DNA-binding protein
MNHCRLSGKITSEPNIEYRGEKGFPVCKFRFSVKRQKNGYDPVNVKVIGDAAVTTADNFEKDMIVEISGELHTAYKNSAGETKYWTEIETSEVPLICNENTVSKPKPRQEPPEEINLDDLPF